MPTVPGVPEQTGDAQHSSPPPSAPMKDAAAGGRACAPPSIVLPEPGNSMEENCLESSRPHSPSFRSSRQSRSSFSSPSSLMSVDKNGHVIDLIHDSLPDVRMSEEDKKKNLQLLEEAKKVSEKFLTRRGRRSRCSLSDSPTGMSSPSLSPKVSPVPSRSNSFTFPAAPGSDPGPNVFPAAATSLPNTTKGLTDRKQNDQRKISQGRLTPRPHSLAATSKGTLYEQKENFDPLKHMSGAYKAPGPDLCKPSLIKTRISSEQEFQRSILKKPGDPTRGGASEAPGVSSVAFQVPGSHPLPVDSNFVSRVECLTAGNRPPLLRALSWDSVEPEQRNNKSTLESPEKDFVSNNDKCNNKLSKFTGLKDFHIQPVRLQKLSKLREEHKLMRSQNLTGQKLPDLSEAAEQERGPSPVQCFSADDEDEGKGEAESDVMPNIPDILLRKLRVHKGLPSSAPPLTEKEVENVFIQLSLAFRNDSYTLESRLNQAERGRTLTEDNNEKELENFKAAVMSSASLWQNSEHRESYQKLLEDICVLHRLITRLSSRAEMVGAVRQEKRMSRATEVMMQYVENLKRTYEKDHAELMEYKKLANQNSSRSYSASEDGVPRSSRSMSLTIGKNMPRRRVSVAVVPKFNLLNIPGQSPSSSPMSTLSTMAESPSGGSRSSLTASPGLSPLIENGKPSADTDEMPGSGLPPNCAEDISAEMKAKIEEEAYNKGYQEGLKKVQEFKEEEEEEKLSESPVECEEEGKEEFTKMKGSKIEECLDYLHMLYPKLLNHWSVFSIMAAVIVLLAVLLSVYNSFSSCTEMPEGGHGKATCSVPQRYSWWTSGSQHKQRRQ
ncbi:inositol 1,4,5-triphosphate receptor associated 1 isoform X1 [Bufo gargarizans]|uniref:inositol 1,4,5-triphosphate receptor associated 1 isoform X1 n=2 Tax=Bufo gargarizans TaxID=30331 RepID=UPI001CF24EE4|nr:inositol 1,4,5-triphosphate receptor associated 1 isoform X1 [Bufo gargarizans]